MAETTPTPTESERQPTVEDMRAIADAAVQAAQEQAARSDDAERAGQAGARAAQREAQAREITLPKELIKQISDASAKATVAQMRREFEVARPDPEPAGEPERSATAEQPAPEPHRTFADRFLGR